MNKIKLALIGPNKLSQTPTFIQQHKNNINADLIFYFNGYMPIQCSKSGLLSNKLDRLIYTLKIKLKLTDFTIKEQALKNSFIKNKVQVVIAEYGVTAATVLKICKSLNLPLIPIFHGYDANHRTVLQKNKYSYRDLFAYSKNLVCVSNSIKSNLISFGCSPSKIVITPCAPDNKFNDIKPSFQKPLFAAVGRFVDKKAPYYTIFAFKEVLTNFPDAQLKIAGNGPLYSTCKNLIRHLNLEANIELLGTITPEQIMKLFSQSLAFIQHSITAENGDSEGSPVAISEASTAGLPIISTYHAGIPELVIDNKTGFLVTEHDVSSMANKMKLLLNDYDLAKQMGSKGKLHIQTNYSQEIHINTLNKLIENSI